MYVGQQENQFKMLNIFFRKKEKYFIPIKKKAVSCKYENIEKKHWTEYGA